MKLKPQQQKVYDFLKRHPGSTIREIRDATRVMKPDMRIAEMNFASRNEMGEELVVNTGRNRSREVLKSIREPLRERQQVVEYLP
jgi:hypothetical protein